MTISRCRLVTTLLLSMTVAGPAFAQNLRLEPGVQGAECEPSPQSPWPAAQAPPVHRQSNGDSSTLGRWYGWQALPFDVAAGLAPYIAYRNEHYSTLSQRSPAAVVIDAAAPVFYLTAAPVIHAVHHNYGRMGASIVVRVLLPLAVLAFTRTGSCSQGCDTFGNAYGGAVAGAAVAALVDDLALAWRP